MNRRLIPLVLMLTLVPAITILANGKTETAKTAASKVVVLELWDEHNNQGAFDVNHPWSRFLAEHVGVAVKGPFVSWNGGSDYIQQLRLRVASGNLPDVFLPWDGIEVELAKQGALVELSDLLPKYAPTIWKGVPKEIWDIVRANSPDGKSIYYIPSVWNAPYGSGFIRKDWMDRLGVSNVPATITDFEQLLRMVKTQDANGNGDPNDEIPAGGRQNARWMDQLYAPFGVAMYEGIPQFALYNGQMTYAGVTPNMRAATAWLAKLYKEGLLDPETLLNSKQVWDGKVANDQVFTWFHIAKFVYRYAQSISKIQPKVDIEYLPALTGTGFQPAYYNRVYRRPQWCFAKTGDMTKVIAGLKLLEFLANPANDETIRHGAEGLQYKIVNGKEVRIPLPADKWVGITNNYLVNMDTIKADLTNKYIPEQLRPYYAMAWKIVQEAAKGKTKPIEGQALPDSIYNGYPDIQSHKLYYEYATKIILGQWPISKFDEFVQKWNESGGAVVTQRARAFWAKFNH